MSQSPQAAVSSPETSYLDAWQGLAKRIQQGASFSGRERNCCFLNTGSIRFANVSSVFGLDHIDDSRTYAVTDWDHDGDLDLWQANRTGPRIRFLKNENSPENNHVSLGLIGDHRQKVNRDGIGARIFLRLKRENGRTRTLAKTLYAGDSFLSQSTKQIHFGFDSDERIDTVEVRWPGQMQRQSFTNVQSGGRYILSQSTGTAKPTESRAQVDLVSTDVAKSKTNEETRLTLHQPEAIKNLSFRKANGESATIDLSKPKTRLVLLWASWCTPCLEELKHLSEQSAKLKELEVDVVALNVESLDDKAVSDEVQRWVQTWITEQHPPFVVGHARQEMVTELDNVLGKLLYGHRQIPLPSSFLLDSHGMLRTVFSGGITIEQLAKELRFLDASPNDLRDRSVPFAGRWSEDQFVTNPIAIANIYRQEQQLDDAKDYLIRFLEKQPEPPGSDNSTEAIRFRRRLADVFHSLGLIAVDQRNSGEAISLFGKAIRFNEGHWKAWNDLGMILSKSTEVDKAVAAFEKSLEVRPNNLNANNQLGLIKMQQQDYGAAIQQFRRVYERWIPAANNLAWILATCSDAKYRNGQEAVQIGENLARATKHSRPDILDTLAAAYAENGDFEKAVKTATQAVEIANEQGNGELAKTIATRLDLYRQSRPYHAE